MIRLDSLADAAHLPLSWAALQSCRCMRMVDGCELCSIKNELLMPLPKHLTKKDDDSRNKLTRWYRATTVLHLCAMISYMFCSTSVN